MASVMYNKQFNLIIWWSKLFFIFFVYVCMRWCIKRWWAPWQDYNSLLGMMSSVNYKGNGRKIQFTIHFFKVGHPNQYFLCKDHHCAVDVLEQSLWKEICNIRWEENGYCEWEMRECRKRQKWICIQSGLNKTILSISMPLHKFFS